MAFRTGRVAGLLRLSAVSVSYGPVPTVVDVDLQIAAGEVPALLGAKGSGRTTPLHAGSGGALERVHAFLPVLPERAGQLAGTRSGGEQPCASDRGPRGRARDRPHRADRQRERADAVRAVHRDG